MSADATPDIDPAAGGAAPGGSGGSGGGAAAKRVAQGIALLIVAGLLGLLIWQVAHRNTGGAAAKLNATDGAPRPAPAASSPC